VERDLRRPNQTGSAGQNAMLGADLAKLGMKRALLATAMAHKLGVETFDAGSP
jgi:hypothetical protein